MAITDRDVAELRQVFRGALLRRGEEGFDEARRVWNGAIDRRPGLIARCAGADDVVAAIRFARRHGLEASVRGGGHSIGGLSVCEGGLMIDLSLMKAIRSIRRPAQRPPQAASSGASSTGRPSRSGWRRPAGSSATPASAGSPWAAASATSCAPTG